MLGAEHRRFVTPFLLTGEEKRSGDEVGEHAQFAFCELHRVRKEERLIVAYRGQSFSSTITIVLSTSTSKCAKTIFLTWMMIDLQYATSSVVQCSSHPHPPRPLLPPKREKGSQDRSLTRLRSDSVTRHCSGPVAWPSEAVRGVRMTHAKKQRRKENREPVCVMRGAEHLFLQLPFKSQREEIRDVELFKGFTGVLAHFRCNRPAFFGRAHARTQRRKENRRQLGV